jgi:hypothetical protein
LFLKKCLFFQYYLSPGHLSLSTPNATVLDDWKTNPDFHNSPLPDELNVNWQRTSYVNTSNEFMVLRMNIPQTNLNRLHMRAIDVSNAVLSTIGCARIT